MLLLMSDVELVGVTTVGDDRGRRAGYVRRVLDMAGRDEVPVAAGADVSLAVYRTHLGLPRESDYWPEPVPPFATPSSAALDLLERSIESGATLIAIGPMTNLRLLGERRPGILERAQLTVMGGFLFPLRPGFPRWEGDDDFNLQIDVESAAYVLEHADPTLVPLAVTAETALRRAHLDRLERGGAVARLIARQARAFASDERMDERYGRSCEKVPTDIIDFLHDPLAAAIAVGWSQGVKIAEIGVAWGIDAGRWLSMREEPDGKRFRVVTAIDGPAFNETWLDRVCS